MRKFTTHILLSLVLVLSLAMPGWAGLRDRSSQIELWGTESNPGNYIVIPEITAPTGNPASNTGWLYVKDNSGTSALYFEDDAGLVTQITTPASGDVASATELDLPAYGNFFNVTGTTQIESIAAADSIDGRIVVLKFAASVTVADGNNLKLAGNFGATADDTLALICDGTNWFEVSRSAN